MRPPPASRLKLQSFLGPVPAKSKRYPDSCPKRIASKNLENLNASPCWWPRHGPLKCVLSVPISTTLHPSTPTGAHRLSRGPHSKATRSRISPPFVLDSVFRLPSYSGTGNIRKRQLIRHLLPALQSPLCHDFFSSPCPRDNPRSPRPSSSSDPCPFLSTRNCMRLALGILRLARIRNCIN